VNNPHLDDLLNKPAYTVHELAERFGVSRNTIKNWIRNGQFCLPDGRPSAYVLNGLRGRWMVLADAVEWYESGREQTAVIEEDWGAATVYRLAREVNDETHL